MEMKRIVVGLSCIVLLSALIGGCVSSMPSMPSMGLDKTSQVSDSQASKDDDCVPAGQGGPVGFKDKLKAAAINKVVDTAMKKIVGVEGVFLIQEKIKDTCMAKKYLNFADEKSTLLTNASQNLLSAMDDSFTQQEERKGFEAAKGTASQAMEDGDKEDAVVESTKSIESFNKLIEEGAEVDKEALAKVWANAKNLSVRNVEMLSLAKHIGTFAKENAAWSVRNIKKLKPFLGYAKGLADQTTALAQTPMLVYKHFDHYDNNLLKKAQKTIDKEAEAKPIADENGIEGLAG